jgi:hypothetical protein
MLAIGLRFSEEAPAASTNSDDYRLPEAPGFPKSHPVVPQNPDSIEGLGGRLLPEKRRIRLVAYGARLESVLGESPRGFESPILR